MYYVLFTKIMQGTGKTSGTALQKNVLQNLWLKPYIDTITKSFYDLLSKTELLHRYFSRILITAIATIV